MTMVKWGSSITVNASDTFFPNQILEYIIMLAVATGQFTLHLLQGHCISQGSLKKKTYRMNICMCVHNI